MKKNVRKYNSRDENEADKLTVMQIDKQISEVHHRLQEIERVLDNERTITTGMIREIHQLHHKLSALEQRKNNNNKGSHLDGYSFFK